MTMPPTDHASPTPIEGGSPVPDRDVLLTRVMDGRATADEWNAFRHLAAAEPWVWNDLQAMQRDHELLTAEVDRALARAELVALPDPAAFHAASADDRGSSPLLTHSHDLGHAGSTPPQPTVDRGISRGISRGTNSGTNSGINSGINRGTERGTDTIRFERRASGVAKWLGWGVAAMVAISWIGARGPVVSLPATDANTAGFGPARAWGEGTNAALDYYLTQGRENGRVVQELPDRPVIQTTRNPDGTLEVLFLRQILERAVVDDVYRVVRDDLGNPVPIPTREAVVTRPPL